MRVHLAALLAVFVLAIACADPLCCADGCERGGTTSTSTTQTGADCPTCPGAVVPQVSASPVRREIVCLLISIAASSPLSAFHTDVDHPPRLA